MEPGGLAGGQVLLDDHECDYEVMPAADHNKTLLPRRLCRRVLYVSVYMYWRAPVGLEPTTHSLGNCRLTVQSREALIRLNC